MIYLTGDTHGNFERIQAFCERHNTTCDDVMIVLGDAGLNYWLDLRDCSRKEFVAQLPITVFCIHGNHEERPERVPGYVKTDWCGGHVWMQPEYPNLLFAIDGEIYDFAGKKAIAIGGAYSVDKYYRLAVGARWFPTEQPDADTKARVETTLDQIGWSVDFVLSHTVPLFAMPRHAFLPSIDQRTVDNSTEIWLGDIAQRLEYQHWYAGHFHVNWRLGRIQLLFENYVELKE